MSSIKSIPREGIESFQAQNDLNNLVQAWALKNADKIKRSCASCTYAMHEGPFKCCVYSITPPLDVIMNGCDSYSNTDDIPF